MTPEVIRSYSESAFENLCKAAGLECSELHHDRTGKDKIVEWPNISATGLDLLRPDQANRRCEVQIKGTKAGNNSVRVKLSAAEWLVRTDLPTFFCIAPVQESGQVDVFYMFHVRGALLERLLKRLHLADAKKTPLHKESITLNICDGELVQAEKSHLKSWLEKEIGGDMLAYADAKCRERATFGYVDGDSFSMNVTLEALDLSEFVAGFMGDRPLRITRMDATLKRFGVERSSIALDQDQIATLEFLREPSEPITFELRADDGRRGILRGMALRSAVPNIPAEYQRIRIEALGVRLEVQFADTARDGRMGYKLDIDFAPLANEPADVQQVIELVDFLILFEEGNCAFVMECPTAGLPLSGKMGPGSRLSLDRGILANMRAVCVAVRSMWEAAGCDPESIVIADIDAKKIRQAASLLEPGEMEPKNILTLEATDEVCERISSGEVTWMLYVAVAQVGQVVFAVSARLPCRLEREGAKFNVVANSWEPLIVQRLSSSEPIAHYERFVTHLRKTFRALLSAVEELVLVETQ